MDEQIWCNTATRCHSCSVLRNTETIFNAHNDYCLDIQPRRREFQGNLTIKYASYCIPSQRDHLSNRLRAGKGSATEFRYPSLVLHFPLFVLVLFFFFSCLSRDNLLSFQFPAFSCVLFCATHPALVLASHFSVSHVRVVVLLNFLFLVLQRGSSTYCEFWTALSFPLSTHLSSSSALRLSHFWGYFLPLAMRPL